MADDLKDALRVLNKYTDIIFDYESLFVERFFETMPHAEIIELYFSGQNIRMVMVSQEGQHFVDSIAVKDFISWLDEIKIYRFIKGDEND